MYSKNHLHLLRWALYALFAAVIFLLQEYLFAHLKIFGVRPMFAAALTASVALFEGAFSGAVFGTALGFAVGLTVSGTEGFFAFAYMASGFLCGAFCEYMFDKKLAAALLWSFMINIAATAGYFFFYLFIPGHAGGMEFLRVGIPEILYSTAVTPLVYFFVQKIARRLNIAYIDDI